MFRCQNYRSCIEFAMQRAKQNCSDYSYQKLAVATRIPKSYLSKVIHGTAQLSLDQLYLVSDELHFSVQEHQYAELLLEWERSALAVRKKNLKIQIDALRDRHLDVAKSLAAPQAPKQDPRWDAYQLSQWAQIIHITLNIPHLAAHPEKLSEALSLPENVVADALRILENLKIIEKARKGYAVIIQNLHLPRASPLSHIRAMQQMHLGIDQLQRLPRDDAYSFSVQFCATDETRREVQARFIDFLKEIEAKVGSAESHRVFQMNFALFPWTSNWRNY